MVELLVAMGQADIQVVLATNNRAEAQEALATRYLDSGVASALVNSGMVGAALPTPEFFAVCVEVTGCQPDQILFVDHDVANLVSAASVGMRTIALDRTRPESVADVIANIQKAMLG